MVYGSFYLIILGQIVVDSVGFSGGFNDNEFGYREGEMGEEMKKGG